MFPPLRPDFYLHFSLEVGNEVVFPSILHTGTVECEHQAKWESRTYHL